MKNKFSYLLAACILTLSATHRAWAQETENLQGFMAGAQVTDLLGSADVSVGGRYWTDFLGADFAFGFEKANADSSGTDFIDTTNFNINFGGLVGFQKGAAKPHLRLGFGYGVADDDVSDVKISSFDLLASVGVDFLVTPHFVLGLTLLSFDFVIDGEVESGGSSADFDGNIISFLNAVGVSYLF